MLASVRALLANVIDYAGLFPPARLSMDEAIRNYARYRQEPESWMLGRFICPATRLTELDPYHDELFLTGLPFAFSILGRGGKTKQEFWKNLNEDLSAIEEFQERHAKRTRIDSFEAKLPTFDHPLVTEREAPTLSSVDGEFLESVADKIGSHNLRG